MFSSTSLLVLAFASAIAFNVDPSAHKCTSAQIGTLSGYPVQLPIVSLPAYNTDYEVKIPTVPQCIYGENGVYATVCDFDVNPEAWSIDFNGLFVHRKGTAQGSGTVNAVVFCKPSPHQV